MNIYVSMDPKARIEDMNAACAKAKDGNYEYVCLPQWFVYTASEALKGSETKVATILSLPGGTTSSFSKFAEAKQAIANGAALVIVPVNMQHCENKDFAAVKGDLASALVACTTTNAQKRGAKTAALIDGAKLSLDDIRNAVSACSGTSVTYIFIAHNEDAVKALKGEFPTVDAY
jgi:deoxyribose-phosphate aldolase